MPNVSGRLKNVLEMIENASTDRVNLFIVTRTPPKQGKEYSVFQTIIKPEVREIFLNNATIQLDALLDKEDFEYCDLDPIAKYPNCVVETIGFENTPNLEDLLEMINNPNLNSYSDDTPNVLAYAIKFDDIGVTLFQHCPPKKILDASRWIKLREKEGTFSKFEENILTIDPDIIDCIYSEAEEEMYIMNKFPFDQIFGYIDSIKELVSAKLDDIPDDDIIIDVNELFGICQRDNNKLKRLYNVLNNGGLELLNSENVTTINDTHNIGLEFNDDGKIDINGKNAWKIIHILNDDYLKSVVTDNNFLSLNKRSP